MFALDSSYSYILVLEPDGIVQELDVIQKNDNLLITTAIRYEQITQQI